MNSSTKIYDLAQALFMRFGIKSVSMDDIAKDAGMSKKTIYKIIPNKKDLVYNIIQRFIENESKQILSLTQQNNDAIHEIVLIAKHILKLLRKTKPTLMHDLKKYHVEAWRLVENLHLKFIHDCVENNIKKGIQSKLYRSDVNPDVIAKIYVASSSILNDEYVFPSQEYSPAELFGHFIIYHVYGIASEEGKKLFETYKTELL